MSIKKDRERYFAAAHGVQSGVAHEIGLDEREGTSISATSPKFLRVGINMAMAEHAGLAKLLITKGLITAEEYFSAIADAAEAELKHYEENHPPFTFR